jgi:hypothetical protein
VRCITQMAARWPAPVDRSTRCSGCTKQTSTVSRTMASKHPKARYPRNRTMTLQPPQWHGSAFFGMKVSTLTNIDRFGYAYAKTPRGALPRRLKPSSRA